MSEGGNAHMGETHDSIEEASLRQIGIDESDIRRIAKAGGYRDLVREGEIRLEYLDLFDRIVKGRRALVIKELSESGWLQYAGDHFQKSCANDGVWSSGIRVELKSMAAQTPYHDAYLRCLISEIPYLGQEVMAILRDDWLTSTPAQFVSDINEIAMRVACISEGGAVYSLAADIGPLIPIGCKRSGRDLTELARIAGLPRKAMKVQSYLNAWPEITVVRHSSNTVRLTLDRDDAVMVHKGQVEPNVVGELPGQYILIMPLVQEDDLNVQVGPHPETWIRTPTLDPQ